jgi:hypothetical protein
LIRLRGKFKRKTRGIDPEKQRQTPSATQGNINNQRMVSQGKSEDEIKTMNARSHWK